MPPEARRGRRRLVVVQLSESPGGSQNLWVYALTDPRFTGFEKHLLLPAGGSTRLSPEDMARAKITRNEFGSPVPSLSRLIAKRLGVGREPLVKALIALDPDLVWFNLGGLGEIGWIGDVAAACRERGMPYWVIVQHVHEHFFFLSDAHEERARSVANGAVRILTVSERNRRAMELAFGGRLPNVERAVNGIPAEFVAAAAEIATARPPRTDGRARFLAPARFDPAFKGQHLLLEALAGGKWRTRDWRLTLLGGGEHAALLQRLAAYFGLPMERVAFLEHTPDVLSAYEAHDVLVMPSLSEGSPFALVEGMACGRPAVGTPVGGISELVREGITGWLAGSTDVTDVVDALERCWRDRTSWPMRGRAAREVAVAAGLLDEPHQRLHAAALEDARGGRP